MTTMGAPSAPTPAGVLTASGSTRRADWSGPLGLVGPALIVLLAIYVYPLSKLLLLSLGGAKPTLAAYWKFFANPVYLAIFVRTFRISVIVTGLCLIAGYPVAYLLSRVGAGTRQVLLIGILVPFWTSILVRTYAWMVLLQANGVLNKLLRDLHLISRPLILMYNAAGVVIGMVQVLLPFAILPIYASLQNIDPALPAAARGMGAGPWSRLRFITFPLSLPGLAAGGLLVFVQALGYFITPALLGGSRVITLSMQIETQVVDLLDWQFASAIAMVLLLVTVAIVVGFDRVLGLEKVWQ